MDKVKYIKKLEARLKENRISKKQFDAAVLEVNKTISEKPVAEKPVAEKPAAEKPDTKKPVVEKPAARVPKKVVVTPISRPTGIKRPITQPKSNKNKKTLGLIGLLLVSIIIISVYSLNKFSNSTETPITNQNLISDSTSLASNDIEPIVTEEQQAPESSENLIEEASEPITEIEEIEETENSEEIVYATKPPPVIENTIAKIKEFETYHTLNEREKVNHFIKKVIDRKYSKSLSKKELEEYNTILQDAFSEFYKISEQLDQETICEQLSSFKSEFKNNGITMNQEKYKQLKGKGDC